jgi:hypothetical protein
MNPDGSKFYILGSSNKKVYQYSTAVPFTLAGSSYDNKSFDISAYDDAPEGLSFNADGTKMYICGNGSATKVWQFTLTTAWDVSTAQEHTLNEEVYVPTDNDEMTLWTTYHTVDIDVPMCVIMQGEIVVKCSEDSYLDCIPAIYQPYNPEFGFTDVTRGNKEWHIKRAKVTANEEVSIPIYSIIHAVPTNTGMSTRPQALTTRIRVASAEDGNGFSVSLRSFKLLLTFLPSNYGSLIASYDATGRERTSSTDITNNGEAPTIVYPDPTSFNIDNYEDSDDG